MRSSSGFAHIALLIGGLLIVTAGGSGYYVYRQNHRQTQVSATVSTNSSTVKPAPATSQTKAEPVVGANLNGYLDIKEWGVKLPVSGSIADAYYKIAANNADVAKLGLKSLNKLDANCSPDQIAAGEIYRQTARQHDAIEASGMAGEDNPVGSVKVGDYYYGFIHMQSTCSEQQAVMDLQLKLQSNQNFEAALDHLQAD